MEPYCKVLPNKPKKSDCIFCQWRKIFYNNNNILKIITNLFSNIVFSWVFKKKTRRYDSYLSVCVCEWGGGGVINF